MKQYKATCRSFNAINFEFEVNEKMFCNENGYSQDDIDTIISLNINETWTSNDHLYTDQVTRIS